MEERIIALDELLEELNGDILGKPNDANYVGIATITRRDLEKLKASNNKAKIRMVGTLIFSEDVTPELARETIESVKVLGKIKASNEVKKVLNIL
jgi:Ribbon-Helix-Helix transcriptional regulator family